MKIKKVLLALRHTVKGGPSEYGAGELPDSHIGSTGRACIKAIELPDDIKLQNIDVFGSGICRTHQELATIILVNELDGEAHDPLLNMGNEATLAEWMKTDWKNAIKETGSNMLGLKQALGDDQFEDACQACASDIRNAFTAMEYNYGLGVFHTPTIEMAARALGFDYPGKLAEDNGVIFILYEDESVACTGTWTSGDKLPEIG